jgi:hypothetical protein
MTRRARRNDPSGTQETVQNLGVNTAEQNLGTGPGCRDRMGRCDAVAGIRGTDQNKGHRPVVHPQVLDGLA